MLWLVFVLTPLLFAALAYVAAAGRIEQRAVVLGAVVLASLECWIYWAVLGAWSWLSVVAACALSVLGPWLAALAFVWYVPLRRRERSWAVAVPLVYVAVLAIGVAVGDATGWVPHERPGG